MNEGTLVIKRVIPASPAEVFKAWIDPKQVAQWYGPEGFTSDIHEFEAKEGGRYRLTMTSPTGDSHPLRGIFKTIQPPKKLVLTWQWEKGGGMEGMDAETIVTVTFKDLGGKTEMVSTHELPNKESRNNHDKGWSSSFVKLEKLFA